MSSEAWMKQKAKRTVCEYLRHSVGRSPDRYAAEPDVVILYLVSKVRILLLYNRIAQEVRAQVRICNIRL